MICKNACERDKLLNEWGQKVASSDLILDIALTWGLAFANDYAVDDIDGFYAEMLNEDNNSILASVGTLAKQIQNVALSTELGGLALPQEPTKEKKSQFKAALREITLKYRHLGYDYGFSPEELEKWQPYFFVCSLFVECLKVALLPDEDRQRFRKQILLPFEDMELTW